MEKYNKTQLIHSVYEALQKEDKPHITKDETERVINEFIQRVKTAIISGEKVLITGFCGFSNKTYKGREYVNPLTGEPIKVPSRNRPRVKFSQVFVDNVSDANPINKKSTRSDKKAA
ncbi:MAG: HU family DNA-binding protein [Trichodesmium sp. MAG_R03]|nr:HU family DNA-binding protein [Trichodesmium sp. MAG_R03]